MRSGAVAGFGPITAPAPARFSYSAPQAACLNFAASAAIANADPMIRASGFADNGKPREALIKQIGGRGFWHVLIRKLIRRRVQYAEHSQSVTACCEYGLSTNRTRVLTNLANAPIDSFTPCASVPPSKTPAWCPRAGRALCTGSTTMRKADIHKAAAEHLAMCGHGAGSYAWLRVGRRIMLRVLTTPDAKLSKSGGDLSASCYLDLRLPSGKTSRKALAAALALIPTIGSPKPVAPQLALAPYVQHDMRLQ